MQLQRPLIILDVETTGTDVREDRVIQIATCKVNPDWSQEEKKHLVNPGRPIPAEATAVHGITDEMVRSAPPFAKLAASLVRYLEGADLCGFNARGFDLPILWEEFKRAGVPWSLDGTRVPDAMALFYHFHPRDLAGAVRVYIGVEFKDAHDALADVRATRDVFFAQLEEHGISIEQAAALCDEDRPLRLTDFDRFFEESTDGLRFIQGKHRGKLLDTVARDPQDNSYLDWLIAKVPDVQIHMACRDAQIRARGQMVPRVGASAEPEPQGDLGI